MPVHPFFSVAGITCCILLMLWIVPALLYIRFRWRISSKAEIVMVVFSLMVAVAIVLRDMFFAQPK